MFHPWADIHLVLEVLILWWDLILWQHWLMEPAVGLPQCFHSYFKHYQSSIRHNCQPVNRWGNWDTKQKPKKGSVIRVYERSRVTGRCLRVSVSRLNALENPHMGIPELWQRQAEPRLVLLNFSSSPPYLRLGIKALKTFQISTWILPQNSNGGK